MVKKALIVSMLLVILTGCEFFVMDVWYTEVIFINNSDSKVQILESFAYPDTSLSRAKPSTSVRAHSRDGIIEENNYNNHDNFIIFVFDSDYFVTQLGDLNNLDNPPDTYLDENEALARYILSKEELININKEINFPDSTYFKTKE